MDITADKIREKLRKHLGREPKDSEVANGAKDLNITNEIIVDEMNLLNQRVAKIEEVFKKELAK